MGRHREPHYGSAARIARLVTELRARPHGWRVQAIIYELRIAPRTMYRYRRALREHFLDDHGAPEFEEIGHGDATVLRRAVRTAPGDVSTGYDAAFLYFALAVFQFLEGTVIKEGVAGLWERFARALPKRLPFDPADLPRKFHALSFGAKDYRRHDAVLDAAITCLVYQHRMDIEYESARRATAASFQFEPYTLTMFRGGLYLIGRRDPGDGIITLAVERMRRASKLPERFAYPPRYSPDRYAEGAFGIINDPRERTYVELLILNRATHLFLRSRRLHRTQRFRPRKDGTVVLSMTVHGTEELSNWIMSLVPYVRVLRPRSLRDEIRERLEQGAALHRAGRNGRKRHQSVPQATRT